MWYRGLSRIAFHAQNKHAGGMLMADGPSSSSPGQPRKRKIKRRIPESGEGRLRFQQGDPHALDVQLDEARDLNAQLLTTAAQLPELLAALEEFQQVPGYGNDSSTIWPFDLYLAR